MIGRLAGFLLARSPRERWLMLALVVVALPLGWWQGVIVPLQTRHHDARATLQEERALAEFLTRARAEIADLPAEGSAEADGALSDLPTLLPGLSEVEDSLRTTGLADSLDDLAGTEDGGMRLRLDNVAFTELMPWLVRFEQTTGYRLEELTLQRRDAPGLVEATILLTP